VLCICFCVWASEKELQVLRAATAKVYALISEKEKLANYLHHRHIINMAGWQKGIAAGRGQAPCGYSWSQKSHKFGMTATVLQFFEVPWQ